jgi:hypothetical protein
VALHPRQLVRDAVVAQLTGATVAGPRVYDTLEVPHRRAELPAISVYTPDEQSDATTTRGTAPREMQRELQLVVEGVVKRSAQDEKLTATLDALALEIETAIFADDTLGDTASDTVLVGTSLVLLEDGDRTMASIRLEFAVTYYSYAPESVAADDFRTADVRYNLANAVNPANEAHDVVEIPEE